MNCFITLYIFLVLTILLRQCSCHLLSNLFENRYKCVPQRVLHISLFKERVFLSILNAFGEGPTFLESQWLHKSNNNYSQCIANDRQSISQAFPHLSQHQILNNPCYPINCNLIQQARWSHIDQSNGLRLWLLDIGTRDSSFISIKYNCPSKLIIFNIAQKVPRQEKKVLLDLPQNSRHILDIKLRTEASTTQLTNRAIRKCNTLNGIIYIVFNTKPYLIAYDICTSKWHTISLWSHKYPDIQLNFPVRPRNIAFNQNGFMLVADDDGFLYIDQKTKLMQNNGFLLNLIGTLLGPTDHLLITSNDTLFYVLEKFGAVVRCMLKFETFSKNITTEDNEILQLTDQNIQQIFSGPNDSIWLLPAHWLQTNTICYLTTTE